MRGLFGWVMVCAALAPAPALAKTVDAVAAAAPQQASASVSKASSAINDDSTRLLRLYRELHARPRRAGVAASKAATVAAELGRRGFEVRIGPDGTQVVAILRNGQGPTLVYRADAGPHVEAAPRPPTRESRRGYPGDANLTWMLGMANAVAALRADWAGTLVLVSEATRREDDVEPAGTERAEARLGLPAPDVVLAFGASSAPLGSMLGVRGRRRPGTDSVDVSVHRFGVYEGTPYQDSGRELAAATIRRYGVPDDAIFGYVLVGVADRQQVSDAPSVLESAPFGEDDAVPLDLAAIPLGAKVATVAVLELLAKPKPRPRDASQWTIHQY
jgi:hippurate hydrolase